MSEINAGEVFKQLKKQNGEKFAQVIRGDRTHDGDLCTVPNIVHILQFAGNDEDDAEKLRNVIKEIYLKREELQYNTDKDPLELLDKAGYKAFVVKNEKQQNSIAGYFRSQKAVDFGFTGGNPRTNVGTTENGELICTIYTNLDIGLNRFDDYYIIHAIKKEAYGDDKLPEKDWHIKPSKEPQRQDEYGTSVISIQIAKSGGFISIKNRYNHTVTNPDATFNNNPDAIIPGLSDSLKKYFNVDFTTAKTPIPDNYRMVHDQFVQYNFEINNVYFGPNYYFSGSAITKLDKDYEIMLDNFILDTRTGEITSPGDTEDNIMPDSGYDVFQKLFKGKKIKIENNPENKKEKVIFVDGIKKIVVSDGQIVELNLPGIKTVGDRFLSLNKNIRSLSMPDLEKTGSGFLYANKCIKELSLPKLKKVGDSFLSSNQILEKFYLPALESVCTRFLSYNTGLTEISLPKLQGVGDRFLECNFAIKKVYLPVLTHVGSNFLHDNLDLTELSLPKLKTAGYGFLADNERINKVYFPSLEAVTGNFMDSNTALTEFVAPKLSTIWSSFLSNNAILKKLQISPKIRQIGKNFLPKNTELTQIYLPEVTDIDSGFLSWNNKIKEIDLPNVVSIGDDFMNGNVDLISIRAPKLKKTGKDFLTSNRGLTELDLPEVQEIGPYSLQLNHNFVKINLPNIIHPGYLSPDQPGLKKFNAPKMEESRLEYFVRGHTDIAFDMAKQRVQEKIDKMYKEAMEKLNKQNQQIIDKQ